MKVYFYRSYNSVIQTHTLEYNYPNVNYFLLIYHLKDKLECECKYENDLPVKLIYEGNVIDANNGYVEANNQSFLNLVKEEINKIETRLISKMKIKPKFVDNELYSNSLVFKFDLTREQLRKEISKIASLFKNYKNYEILENYYRFYTECNNEMDLINIFDYKLVVTPLNILRERVNYFTIDLLELFKIIYKELL